MKTNISSVLKDKISVIIMYMVLIPFVRPRGFDEYFYVYKFVFTVWIYVSAVLIIGLCIYKRKLISQKVYRLGLYLVLAYYTLFVGVTLIVQRGINEGLQKMFIAPVFCVFCMLCLCEYSKAFIATLSNLMILNYVLNIAVQCISKIFGVLQLYHIVFLGHVQIISVIGILGIYLSYILYITDDKSKLKALLLFALSAVTMLMSGTAASYLSLLLIALGIVILSIKKTRKYLCMNPLIFIIAFFVINCVMMLFVNFWTGGYMFRGIDFSGNGRTLIWKEALNLLDSHMLTGYGAYGVLIKTFWSEGMNYAHNELLQRMLDGGVVLLISFGILLIMFVSRINKIQYKNIISFSNVCLVALLFVMLFESVTEYYYVFIILTLFEYLPEITENIYRQNKKISE